MTQLDTYFASFSRQYIFGLFFGNFKNFSLSSPKIVQSFLRLINRPKLPKNVNSQSSKVTNIIKINAKIFLVSY